MLLLTVQWSRREDRKALCEAVRGDLESACCSRRSFGRKLGGLAGCGLWQVVEGILSRFGSVKVENLPLSAFELSGTR